MTNLIQLYRGRAVDSAGDNIKASFASVVDGVNCAMEMLSMLPCSNYSVPQRAAGFFMICLRVPIDFM
jgi:hypothetical protein